MRKEGEEHLQCAKKLFYSQDPQLTQPLSGAVSSATRRGGAPSQPRPMGNRRCSQNSAENQIGIPTGPRILDHVFLGRLAFPLVCTLCFIVEISFAAGLRMSAGEVARASRDELRWMTNAISHDRGVPRTITAAVAVRVANCSTVAKTLLVTVKAAFLPPPGPEVLLTLSTSVSIGSTPLQARQPWPRRPQKEGRDQHLPGKQIADEPARHSCCRPL